MPAPMFASSPSPTHDLPLRQVLERLREHPAVDAILLAGSTATDKPLPPHSDIDLFLVLSTLPAPVKVALTTIDARLADVVFMATSELDAILAEDGTCTANARPGVLIAWLHSGTIVHDRLGRLARLRERSDPAALDATAPRAALHAGWFRINFNLKHAQRMLASDDPVYQTALQIRFLYNFLEMWHFYFQARGLPSRGEKADVRHLQAHDPALLALFETAFREPDSARKVTLYTQIAQAVLAPVGSLWPERFMAVDFTDEAPPNLDDDMIAEGLALWDRLVAP